MVFENLTSNTIEDSEDDQSLKKNEEISIILRRSETLIRIIIGSHDFGVVSVGTDLDRSLDPLQLQSSKVSNPVLPRKR